MTEINTKGKQMMSQAKFYMGYSRWDEAKGGYETWDESVERVMNMHREKYADKMTPELEAYISFAEQAYKDKLVLGAQRALQFGGAQLFQHEARMYNCSVSYCDRPAFFSEAMYLLLCGCGVGFSVQSHHVDKLPLVHKRFDKRVKVFQVPDTIEGWADSFGVLLSSYFVEGAQFPEYKGCQVHFDFSKIRPKGALISGGFKAPGPDGLREALIKCEALLERLVADTSEPVKVPTLTAYDFVMHMSDAVLSGGVRRSATICVFDKNDESMLKAKTGDWFVDNPQRGRSNNSAMLLRDQLTREEWATIMESVKSFGEPGFIFSDSTEYLFNPCVEIGMKPVTASGASGFQFCNLTEINGGQCVTPEIFMRACKAGAILGTLQVGYTNFNYLTPASKEITEREALLGVSITGWMNNPDVLFNPQNMREGALLVRDVNKMVAELIGVNQAARCTAVKPSGNASVILGTASGIHGEHSPLYFRNVQMNTQDEVTQVLMATNPKMVEKSVWDSSGHGVVVSFPVESKPGSIYKDQLLGVKQLEFVKLAQENWVEYGTNVELCVDPTLRHNVSNTITVDDWDEVEEYIYQNRAHFAGISLLSSMGDRAYAQAPFTEVFTAQQILDMYGEASLFASGLIVGALQAFGNNLWMACDTALGYGLKLDPEDSADLLKRDWVRRARKFADQNFGGDLQKLTFMLKDCHNLHKWVGIKQNFVDVDFSKDLNQQSYTEVDSMGAQGCAGGVCEISF